MPDYSKASEIKYEIKAIITISNVSVMALCVKNLACLNKTLLKIPHTSPINIDTSPSIKKFPAIVNTLRNVKLKSVWKL